MNKTLERFVKALRANNLAIAPSQIIEASQTFALVGYESRAILRHALGAVLTKSLSDKNIYYDVFDRFFSFQTWHGVVDGDSDGESKSQSRLSQDAPFSQNDFLSAGSGSGGNGQNGAGAQGDGREKLTDVLERGDIAALQQRLAQASQTAALSDVKYFTQRGMAIYRVLAAMGAPEVEQKIADFSRSSDADDQLRAKTLKNRLLLLRQNVGEAVDRQLAIFAAPTGQKLREEFLGRVRLSAIERADIALMQSLVRKMAKKLIALNRRRKRRARRGQLDLRRTLRANVQFDGLLFRTIWKRRRIERPKIMVLADVSGSVALVARFLLALLHALHDIAPKVRSFAFSSQLGEVTQWFETLDFERAMALTLERFGGSTDYGRAFEDFKILALDAVDRRTSVFILGDARNNNGAPRADILQAIGERAKRVIFLNPEPCASWNSGDSIMRVYQPYCSRAESCATLKDLERIVGSVLRAMV